VAIASVARPGRVTRPPAMATHRVPRPRLAGLGPGVRLGVKYFTVDPREYGNHTVAIATPAEGV